MDNSVQSIENNEIFCAMDQLNKEWLQAYNADPNEFRLFRKLYNHMEKAAK